jgi:hypothetical protein
VGKFRPTQIIAIMMLAAVSASAHDEHTSEWNYIDERWPAHIGALMDEWEAADYLRGVFETQSQPLEGWHGRDGDLALDKITVCGLYIQAYLRQRPKGTYVLLIVKSADGKDHVLKWIPVEYRFDNDTPLYFKRREGAEQNRRGPDPFFLDKEQQENIPDKTWQDPKTNRELKEPLHYLFDNNSPQRTLHRAGGAFIRGKFRYLEALKFPDPRELARHERMQIYLPWIDNCPTKPDIWFERDTKQEVHWDYPLRAWLSAGAQFMLDFHEEGWNAVHPQPAYYLHFSHYFPHHGLSLEAQAASFQSATKENTSETGYFGKASYGYAIQLLKYLYIAPEVGMRGLFGIGATKSYGIGGGFNLAWEVPGTRHQNTGQRLIFESGCDFQRYYSGLVNGHDLRAAFGACKLGIGLGW